MRHFPHLIKDQHVLFVILFFPFYYTVNLTFYLSVFLFLFFWISLFFFFLNSIMWTVYSLDSFPRATITQSHKLSGLKQKFIVPQFKRPEGLRAMCWQNFRLSESSREWSVPCLGPSSCSTRGSCLADIALQPSIFTSYFPWVLPFLYVCLSQYPRFSFY